MRRSLGCQSALGQMAAAAVVSRHHDLTTEALDHACQMSPRLANFKPLGLYFFINEIPAAPMGKVDRTRLTEALAAQLETPLESSLTGRVQAFGAARPGDLW